MKLILVVVVVVVLERPDQTLSETRVWSGPVWSDYLYWCIMMIITGKYSPTTSCREGVDGCDCGCVLGVNGGLYYVRNGTVNDYALTFNLLLRADITEIYFNWNASADQSPVKRDVIACNCIAKPKLERSKTNEKVCGCDGRLTIRWLFVDQYIQISIRLQQIDK